MKNLNWYTRSVLLTIIVPIMVNAINDRSQNIALNAENNQDLVIIVEPKVRSWRDLIQEMSNDLIPVTELNIQECTGSPTKFKKIGSYFQNILYSDYKWNRFETKSGKNCIELRSPRIGFLSEFETQVLLSASKGYHFEELGFWEESDKYYEQLRGLLDICDIEENESNIKSKDILISNSPTNNEDNHNLLEEHYNYGNFISKQSCVLENRNGKDANKSDNKVVLGDESRILANKFDFPWMALIKRRKGSSTNNCSKKGSGFYINSTTVVTAAHNIIFKPCLDPSADCDMCTNTRWRIFANGVGVTTSTREVTTNWENMPGLGLLSNHEYDFGAFKVADKAMIPWFPLIFEGNIIPIQTSLYDVGQTLGFPFEVGGQNVSGDLYVEERSVLDEITVLDDANSDLLIAHFFDQTKGQSGGPLFFTRDPNLLAPAIGIMSVSANNVNYATAIDLKSSPIIQQWASDRAPNVIINISSPEYLQIINWNTIDNDTFNADYENTARNSNPNDINTNLIWESDIDGPFGIGNTVTAIEAKSVLRSGVHLVKLGIDTGDYLGEGYVELTIIGPEGAFNIESNHCIINLQNNPNSCNTLVSWNTTNAPDALVYNNRTQIIFATGTQGTKVPFTAIKNMDTELILYASADKVYDIDRVVMSAKTPTGVLSNNSPACSLQPSPINPIDGTLRDAKATPPGCGTELSWSNVQWASPSIFYKLSGSSTWQHLYKITCQLNGEVCTGTINTDDLIPELIPLNGVEFKLLQFNGSSSGVLTSAFTVTAHRFADIYEYDNGDVTDFNDFPHQGFPTNMVIDNRLSTAATLGVAQHNHNFHSPAVYDSKEDIDSIQIKTSDFSAVDILKVTVFNMANGLDVDISLKCAGIINGGIFDGQSGVFDFQHDPSGSIVTDPATGSKSMQFQVTKQTTAISSNIDCIYNRVVIRRTAGTPSENLSYSAIVNYASLPDQYEDDDTLETANNNRLDSGETQSHNFVDDTVDYMNLVGPIPDPSPDFGSRFELTFSNLGSNVNICVHWPSPWPELFVPPGAPICDIIEGTSIIVRNWLGRGVKIYNQSPAGADTGYTVKSVYVAPAPADTPDQYENDDTEETANNNRLDSGEIQSHNFGDDRVDYMNLVNPTTNPNSDPNYHPRFELTFSNLGSNLYLCVSEPSISGLNSPNGPYCGINEGESVIVYNWHEKGIKIYNVVPPNSGVDTGYTVKSVFID